MVSLPSACGGARLPNMSSSCLATRSSSGRVDGTFQSPLARRARSSPPAASARANSHAFLQLAARISSSVGGLAKSAMRAMASRKSVKVMVVAAVACLTSSTTFMRAAEKASAASLRVTPSDSMPALLHSCIHSASLMRCCFTPCLCDAKESKMTSSSGMCGRNASDTAVVYSRSSRNLFESTMASSGAKFSRRQPSSSSRSASYVVSSVSADASPAIDGRRPAPLPVPRLRAATAAPSSGCFMYLAMAMRMSSSMNS
mmetsp:Transcript_3470/g.12626  ORF Transcript_3470/g.12626 Transcript_3470/m.12626 type:complete len:258 (+) Transcript_3470:212-985(+)